MQKVFISYSGEDARIAKNNVGGGGSSWGKEISQDGKVLFLHDVK